MIFDAIDELKKAGDAWLKDTQVWLYRGAWQEWGVNEIEMAVPLSPKNVLRKEKPFSNINPKRIVRCFQGQMQKEFWQRAEQRNTHTANQYNLLDCQSLKLWKALFDTTLD